MLSAGVMLCWGGLPARSQIDPGDLPNRTPPPAPKPDDKPKPPQTGCTEQVSSPIPIDSGVAQLEFSSPCRKGELLPIAADDLNYEIRFGASGKLTASIPLFHDKVEIAWKQADGSTARQIATFGTIRDAFAIALVWPAKVELSLHVLETSGLTGGSEVRFDQQSQRPINGIGGMRAFRSDGRGVNIDLYTLPIQRNPRRGNLPYRVEFVSRGTRPALPFCGQGELAAPVFQVWILRYGKLEKVPERGFGSVPCGGTLPAPIFVRGDASLAP
jgi:hypothetical protein